MQLSLTGHLTRDIHVHKTSKDNDIILGQIATTDYVNGKFLFYGNSTNFLPLWYSFALVPPLSKTSYFDPLRLSICCNWF